MFHNRQSDIRSCGSAGSRRAQILVHTDQICSKSHWNYASCHVIRSHPTKLRHACRMFGLKAGQPHRTGHITSSIPKIIFTFDCFAHSCLHKSCSRKLLGEALTKMNCLDVHIHTVNGWSLWHYTVYITILRCGPYLSFYTVAFWSFNSPVDLYCLSYLGAIISIHRL